MHRQNVSLRSLGNPLICLLTWVFLITLTRAATGDLCSSSNTGADYQLVSNLWQSHGACSQTCGDKYAFAIIQGKQCWCSNYAPASTVSNSNCNKGCPGFPQEKCGNEDSGLYGYVALGPAPAGTQGANSASQPSQTPPSNSIITSIVSATSDSSSSTWIPTPITTVRTVTGGVQTVTLTPTEPPSTVIGRPTSALSTTAPSKNKSSISGGAIAGIVIGIISVLILLLAGIVFCRLRRRRNQEVSGDGSIGSKSPPRSRGSLSGLISSVTGENKQMSETAPDIQVWPAKPSAARQPSHDYIRFDKDQQPRLVDQRLDPRALWGRTESGSSRASLRSFRDDQDYSRRVLRLTNPDRG